jgi:hypothetical protein
LYRQQIDARLRRAGADAQRRPVESIVPLQTLRIVEGAERGESIARPEACLEWYRADVMRCATIAAWLGILVGCSGLGPQVRERAAFDFSCPEARVAVDALRFGYVARGCGKEAVYLVQHGRVTRDSEIREAVEKTPAPRDDGIPDTNSVGVR